MIEKSSLPRYLAIAEAIEQDITTSRLKAGERLPTHRDLAKSLDVTIGTITRAYQEAQKRGLITGEVGRGSFVREQPARTARLTWDRGAAGASAIELGQNFPVPLPMIEQRVIGPILRELGADAASVISQPWPALLDRHRRTGATWFERYGLKPDPRQVLISTGFQSALWAIVSALCGAGDVILADQLTTPGLLTLAGALKVRVVGVAGDEHGMQPAALQRAIEEHQSRVAYLTPTIHTPTTIVMPPERRKEIAAIADRMNVMIIEDDDNLPLMADTAETGGIAASGPPTLASLAAERVFTVSDVSRSLGLGLRLSYVLCPTPHLDEIAGAMTSTTWMPAPVVAETVARLIEGAGAPTIIAARREELAARHELAQRILPSNRIAGHVAGHHLWLRLPDERRSESFAAEAQRRGVILNSAATFAVSKAMSPGAARLCVGGPRTREELETGLRIIAEILHQRPGAGGMVV